MVSTFPTISRWLSTLDHLERRSRGDMTRLALELRAALLEEMTLRDQAAAAASATAIAPTTDPITYPEIHHVG